MADKFTVVFALSSLSNSTPGSNSGTVTCLLEGSLDNSNWYTLADASLLVWGPLSGGFVLTKANATSGTLARYVRANYQGGYIVWSGTHYDFSATVDAYIAALRSEEVPS